MTSTEIFSDSEQVGAIVESQQSHRESGRSWICYDRVLETIAAGDSIRETLSIGGILGSGRNTREFRQIWTILAAEFKDRSATFADPTGADLER